MENKAYLVRPNFNDELKLPKVYLGLQKPSFLWNLYFDTQVTLRTKVHTNQCGSYEFVNTDRQKEDE